MALNSFSQLLTFFFLLFIALSTRTCDAQGGAVVLSADPTGRCELYTGQACSSLYGRSTYVYVNSSQSQLAAEASAVAALSVAQGTLAGQCLNISNLFICASLLPLCIDVNATGIRAPVCSSLCGELNQDCLASLTTPFDCNYSALQYSLSDGSIYAPSCTSAATLLSLRGDENDTCPTVPYSLHRIDILSRGMSAIDWITLFFVLFVIVFILIDPDKRAMYPSGLSYVCVLLCLALLSFAWTMTSWVGWRSLQCRHRRLCVAQGVLSSFAMISAIAWLCVLILQLLISAASVRLDEIARRFNLVSHIAWIPGIIITAVKPHGSWGAQIGTPVCSRIALPDRWQPYIAKPLYVAVALSFLLMCVVWCLILKRGTRGSKRAHFNHVQRSILLVTSAALLFFAVPLFIYLVMYEAVAYRGFGEWGQIAVLNVMEHLVPLVTALPFMFNRRMFYVVGQVFCELGRGHFPPSVRPAREILEEEMATRRTYGGSRISSSPSGSGAQSGSGSYSATA